MHNDNNGTLSLVDGCLNCIGYNNVFYTLYNQCYTRVLIVDTHAIRIVYLIKQFKINISQYLHEIIFEYIFFFI